MGENGTSFDTYQNLFDIKLNISVIKKYKIIIKQIFSLPPNGKLRHPYAPDSFYYHAQFFINFNENWKPLLTLKKGKVKRNLDLIFKEPRSAQQTNMTNKGRTVGIFNNSCMNSLCNTFNQPYCELLDMRSPWEKQVS